MRRFKIEFYDAGSDCDKTVYVYAYNEDEALSKIKDDYHVTKVYGVKDTSPQHDAHIHSYYYVMNDRADQKYYSKMMGG